MALRRTCRSSFNTASFAALMDARYAGIATAARIATISMTIMSSSNVNPASVPFPAPVARATVRSEARPCSLPFGILGSVQSGALRFGIHVVDILSAEGVAGGIILFGAQAPVSLPGHGIDGNATQEAHFLSLDIDSLHQRLQIRRIVVAVHLGLDTALFGSVLISIDRPAHLPQVPAQLALLHSLDVPASQRHGGRGKQPQDGDRHDQLDQRKTGLAPMGRSRPARAQGANHTHVFLVYAASSGCLLHVDDGA